MKIYQKLSKVQAEIDKLSKDGYNNHMNYNYLTETQVTLKIKELFDKYKIIFDYESEQISVHPYDNAKGARTFLTSVKVTYSFIDAETGESTPRRPAIGQGVDTGDKGAFKAITGAIKYIYMKTFNIPTGDDPEKGRKDEAPQYRTTKETKTGLHCSTCGVEVSAKIAKYSQDKLGKILCYSCQKK